MALSSLYYFAKYVMGFRDMELTPHWELCQFIEKNEGCDILALLPRGTFKSSIISVAYPLWRFARNRDLRILLTSSELQNTKNFLGLIRTNIEKNRVFRSLFGDWVNKDGTWHSTALSLAGRRRFRAEDSITASSVKISKVSQHYDLAICDDIHNDKNITNKDMIDDVERYLEEMLPILDPVRKGSDKPGPRILVGTRWHFDDVYGRITAEERLRKREHLAPAFRMLIRKAITKKGKVYFPTRFSAKYLERLRKDSKMSNYVFSCQYLNDPMPEEDQIFKLRNFGFFNSTQRRTPTGEILPMPELTNKFTTVDPSLGETDTSDYTAIITNGCDAERNMYCWDVVRERLVGNEAILEEMFRVWAKYKPYRFGIEAVQFQKSLVWGFQKFARDRDQWFHIQPLKTDNTITKDLRIRGFEPFVSGHKFYLRVKEEIDLTLSPLDLYYGLVDGQDVLADEMLRFPLAATKDCIDAQAYMPQLVYPAGEPKKEKKPKGMTFDALRKRMTRARKGVLSLR